MDQAICDLVACCQRKADPRLAGIMDYGNVSNFEQEKKGQGSQEKISPDRKFKM